MNNEYNITVEADRQGFRYASIFDDALPSMWCQKVIDKFERNENKEQVETELKGVRHFTEVNISQYWVDENDFLVQRIQEAWRVYMGANHVQFDVQWPKQFGYEQFRMKRYLPNGIDEFAIHTDVGSYASARRFLAFLWYLNDVQDGGATEFGRKKGEALVTIPARRGRLLMFPPLWTHPHWGCKPLSGNKYIISGYLHYI